MSNVLFCMVDSCLHTSKHHLQGPGMRRAYKTDWGGDQKRLYGKDCFSLRDGDEGLQIVLPWDGRRLLVEGAHIESIHPYHHNSRRG